MVKLIDLGKVECIFYFKALSECNLDKLVLDCLKNVCEGHGIH